MPDLRASSRHGSSESAVPAAGAGTAPLAPGIRSRSCGCRSHFSDRLLARADYPVGGAAGEAAGLHVAETRTHLGTVKCPSVDAFVQTEVESTPLRERISDEVYGRIRDDARKILRPFTKRGGAAEIPLEGHVIAARRLA